MGTSEQSWFDARLTSGELRKEVAWGYMTPKTHQHLKECLTFAIGKGVTVVEEYDNDDERDRVRGTWRRHGSERVVPINDASKCYFVPDWLAKSRQEEVRAWATHKYAHVPKAARDGERASPTHKFPKERKPQLADVLLARLLDVRAPRAPARRLRRGVTQRLLDPEQSAEVIA